MKNYFFYEEAILKDLGEGVSRKILAHNGNLMMVEVNFESGAVGPVHTHVHEQITYIVDGEFEFKIGNEGKIVKAGDTIYVQPNIEHGVICLKKGKLLDTFTPVREDFLK